MSMVQTKINVVPSVGMYLAIGKELVLDCSYDYDFAYLSLENVGSSQDFVSLARVPELATSEQINRCLLAMAKWHNGSNMQEAWGYHFQEFIDEFFSREKLQAITPKEHWRVWNLSRLWSQVYISSEVEGCIPPEVYKNFCLAYDELFNDSIDVEYEEKLELRNFIHDKQLISLTKTGILSISYFNSYYKGWQDCNWYININCNEENDFQFEFDCELYRDGKVPKREFKFEMNEYMTLNELLLNLKLVKQKGSIVKE